MPPSRNTLSPFGPHLTLPSPAPQGPPWAFVPHLSGERPAGSAGLQEDFPVWDCGPARGAGAPSRLQAEALGPALCGGLTLHVSLATPEGGLITDPCPQ